MTNSLGVPTRTSVRAMLLPVPPLLSVAVMLGTFSTPTVPLKPMSYCTFESPAELLVSVHVPLRFHQVLPPSPLAGWPVTGSNSSNTLSSNRLICHSRLTVDSLPQRPVLLT